MSQSDSLPARFPIGARVRYVAVDELGTVTGYAGLYVLVRLDGNRNGTSGCQRPAVLELV